MSHLKDWFKQVDKNSDERIDAKELDVLLKRATFTFDNSGIASLLIRLHSEGDSQTITFREFERLHAFLVAMQHRFTSFDRNRDAWLTPDEIHEAITHSGYRLDRQAFMGMLNLFDPRRTGQLKLADFVSMILFLKTCERVFSTFDPTGSGQIELDYDQYVFAVGEATFGCHQTQEDIKIQMASDNMMVDETKSDDRERVPTGEEEDERMRLFKSGNSSRA